MKMFVTGYHGAGTRSASKYFAKKHGLKYVQEMQIKCDLLQSIHLDDVSLQCPQMAHLTEAFLKQGIVYYNEGNLIKKAANESGWNESDPDKFKAEYARADAEYEKALPYMLEAYELDPKSKSAVKALVNIYTNLDKQEEVDKFNAILEKIG